METIYFWSWSWGFFDHDIRGFGAIVYLFLFMVGYQSEMSAIDEHPLKMSVATLTYDLDEEDYSLDLRMFFDDFMVVTQGGVESDYQETSLLKRPSKSQIKNYVTSHMNLLINGDSLTLRVKKVLFEELTIRVVFDLKDLPPPDEIKAIKAVDTIFVDHFSNQRNVIHVELPDRKRRSLLFNSFHRDGTLSW